MVENDDRVIVAGDDLHDKALGFLPGNRLIEGGSVPDGCHELPSASLPWGSEDMLLRHGVGEGVGGFEGHYLLDTAAKRR